MPHTHHIAVLPGDGIGPEVTHAAVSVLEALDLSLTFSGVGENLYDDNGKTTTTEARKNVRSVLE